MVADTPGMRIIERALNLHDRVADDIAPFGGILRCNVCQTEAPLGDIARNLRNGWPECCGYTMTWITQRQLDEQARLDAQP